jgi:hypothetical protein
VRGQDIPYQLIGENVALGLRQAFTVEYIAEVTIGANGGLGSLLKVTLG